MAAHPQDPEFERRVRASFARQAVMTTLGVTLAHVRPGEVALRLPFRADLTQQHGYLHAGIVTSVIDSACGYAALSLMEPGAAVLSVEFKVHLLAPARGAYFEGLGRVVRAGRTVTVVSGELRAFGDSGADATDGTLVAIMTGTMMTIRGRAELVD